MQQAAEMRSSIPDRRQPRCLRAMLCDETVLCFSADRMLIGALLCCGGYAIALLAVG